MTVLASVERDVAIGSLALDSGFALDDIVQRVTIYGEPRADGSNVVLVPHALTGSSRVAEWWAGLVGPGKLFDPARLAVIGINALGSCYGSTGPATLAADGRPYGSRFPVVGVGDLVRAQRVALSRLGIERVAAVVGGSLGGMQALQWALDAPEGCGHAVVVGAYDHFSAMGIALNAIAREAVRLDPNFRGGDFYDGSPPASGIELARKIAMLTYKSEALLSTRFGRRPDRNGGDPRRTPWDMYDVEGYLAHQARAFSERMDANAYLTLTRAMDLFETRERELPPRLPALTFVGVSSDWLFLPRLVEAAADRFARAGADSRYLELQTDHGHDAFLAEPAALAALLAPHLETLLR
ncbi:MAG: homoserine O-acetyltransferase [Candidatus Baltobacteraceae bacterium]